MQYIIKIYKQMEQFDINKVIEHYKLDANEVAEALFPYVRYKDLALKRVLKGEALLNTDQLIALANLAGVLVQDLFSFGNWKGRKEDNCLVMVKGEWKVKLNYNGAFMTLYKGSKIVRQEVSSSAHYSVDAFIEHIESIIKNLKTN